MPNVQVVRRGRVLEVTLNRPRVNAIDRAASQELGAAFARLRDNPDLCCAILTGTGEKVFSAGWDLKALNQGEMAATRDREIVAVLKAIRAARSG